MNDSIHELVAPPQPLHDRLKLIVVHLDVPVHFFLTEIALKNHAIFVDDHPLSGWLALGELAKKERFAPVVD